MKIVDKKENTTLFINVELGEAFKMNDDISSYTYMKITSIIDAEDDAKYNAVCLNDGDLLSVDDEEKVFVYPYSELIIKR